MLINNRNFCLLWLGQWVSQLGDRFYNIALAWWLLERTDSPSIMGLFLAVSLLPELLTGPLAGGLIDRYNRKNILLGSDILRGLIILALAQLSSWNVLAVGHIFAAAIAISLASAFFNPTLMAIIPQVVQEEELTKANSLSQMISGITTIVGPVLGAALVGFLGYSLVFSFNALSYLISALLIYFLKLPLVEIQQPKESLLSSLKEGLQFIQASRPVCLILLAVALAHIFFGSLVVSMPFLAKSLTGNGLSNLGYLEATLGLGLLLGALVLHQKKVQNLKNITLFLALLAMGVCFISLGSFSLLQIKILFPYAATVLFLGATAATASIYWRSLLQISVPNEIAGRIFSIAVTIADTTLPLAMVVFGLLLSNWAIGQLLLFAGLSLVTISGIFISQLAMFYGNLAKEKKKF